MKKIALILVCCLLCTTSMFAQTFPVSGKVVDATDDAPMVGAAVQIEGVKGGEITDLDGNFTIEAKPGDVLIVSFLGKESQEIEVVENQRFILVSLEDDTNRLDEVVIIGYGAVKKRDLTGSVSQVKADDLLESGPTLSINSALQGKVAGMQVKQNDGAPGGGLTIQIRGANSFSTSTQPLYIVDGLPYGGGRRYA